MTVLSGAFAIGVICISPSAASTFAPIAEIARSVASMSCETDVSFTVHSRSYSEAHIKARCAKDFDGGAQMLFLGRDGVMRSFMTEPPR